MATSRNNELVEYLRRTVLLHDGGGLTDGQLLGCFLEQGDDAALAALVRRHGPLVWGVCRRVLGNHHDAEDAFQATFLVLVRKAASVVPREMVANWLYGVASLTARKAKATRAKQRTREKQTVQMPEPVDPENDAGNDLQEPLHRELVALPDKFRASIILCYLEGKTHKEAARQLGVPEGTLAAWLARGRAMLARRLSRRGLGLSAVALTGALVQSRASALVPVSLASSTMQAATLLKAEQAVSGVLSTRVLSLMEGVMKGMLATKFKMTTSLVVAVVLAVGLGTGGLAYRMQAAHFVASAEGKHANVPQAPIVDESPPEQAVFASVDEDKDKDTLSGSGKEGRKEIKVADFNALEVLLPVQVSIKQADAFSVVLTGDDNLLDVVSFAKEGSTLRITSARRSWRATMPLKATITMPDLERVRLEAASRLTIGDFKSTKDLKLQISAASNLEGSIEANNFIVEASGASKVKLKAAAKKDFNLKITGASKLDGSIEANNLMLGASGASTIKTKGSAKKATLSASGACHLHLGDFSLDTAEVKLSGASTAEVAVKTKLDYSLAGACKLHYQGNPTIGQTRSSGASSIRRLSK